MGSSVNAVNNRDMSPLGVLGFRDFSIYCNDQEYEVAKALLEAGALLSVNVPWAARLIKRAAISGHVDYVRLLLNAWERQLSHSQSLSLTARFLAAAALGDMQTMEDVLNIKPEFLNTLPADYPSALETAAKSRNQEAIRFIVSKMHCYAGDHGLALCHVLAHGSEETICLLLSRISFVRKKDLISAVTIYSSVPLALLLGRLGELISERDHSSPQNALEFDDDEEITHNIRRALKVAAATGKTEAVCLLLQFMARHNLDCSQCHLPLVSAAKHGHDEIALIMIRQGHALNTADEHGNTPLIIAASLGRVTIMKALIEASVDPTETNTHGRSPILMAAAGEHHDAVRYLMDTFPLSKLLPPGNPKTDIERMNLLAYAARYNVADLGDYMMTHPDIYGNLVELFFWAACHGKVQLVHALLSHPPFSLLQHESKLRKQERLNQAALIYTASAPEERIRVVKILLHHGADVDHHDLKGRTALSYAAENDYVDTARLLAAAGADTSKASKKGKTPLHYATSDEMVKILYSER
ncbi:ankyrin repeat-containing domain protein [Aspergillus insuetus]